MPATREGGGFFCLEEGLMYYGLTMIGTGLVIASQHIASAPIDGAVFLSVFIGGVGGILLGHVAALATDR